MPKRIIADPVNGFPSTIEDGGKRVQGFYKMVAYVYGPGEVPPAGIDLTTIAELREKYWDAARQILVIPRHGDARSGAFEFGPDLLSETTESTVVHVRPEFVIPGRFPRPKAAVQ